eukprot:gene13146-biopygen6494
MVVSMDPPPPVPPVPASPTLPELAHARTPGWGTEGPHGIFISLGAVHIFPLPVLCPPSGGRRSAWPRERFFSWPLEHLLWYPRSIHPGREDIPPFSAMEGGARASPARPPPEATATPHYPSRQLPRDCTRAVLLRRTLQKRYPCRCGMPPASPNAGGGDGEDRGERRGAAGLGAARLRIGGEAPGGQG